MWKPDLGQEVLGGVESARLVQLVEDRDPLGLRVADADEDGRETHLALQLLHGEVGGAQGAPGLDLGGTGCCWSVTYMGMVCTGMMQHFVGLDFVA